MMTIPVKDQDGGYHVRTIAELAELLAALPPTSSVMASECSPNGLRVVPTDPPGSVLFFDAPAVDRPSRSVN